MGRTLKTCMTSPKVNEVAVCRMGSDRHNLQLIKEKESKIKENEDMVQARQEELINKKTQGHHDFIKETQELVKKRQDIKDAQDVLDMRRQNTVYFKQIFEGL